MNRLICCQCFLVVMMTTCSTATEKDNNNLLKGNALQRVKKWILKSPIEVKLVIFRLKKISIFT